MTFSHVAGTSLLDALSYEGEVTAAVIGAQTYDLVEGTALAATDRTPL